MPWPNRGNTLNICCFVLNEKTDNMKRTIVFILAVVTGCMQAMTVAADSVAANVVRIGYIDRGAVVGALPEMQQAEAELSRLLGEYESAFVAMSQDYNEKVKSYMEGKNSVSEAMKLARRTEITEMESMLNLYKKRYMAELDGKRAELVTPLIQSVDDAIRRVSERNRLTILFDQGHALYLSPDCIDITTEVKQELGISAGSDAK